MVRLPTIHIIHKDWKIPFDVAPFRAIQFAWDDVDDVEAAKAALKTTIGEVVKDGFQVENPITHARGVVQLEKHATPEQQVLLDRLQAIEERLTTSDTAARMSDSRTDGGAAIQVVFDSGLSGPDLVHARGQVEALARAMLPVKAIWQGPGYSTIELMDVIGARPTLERFAAQLKESFAVTKTRIQI
jgi:hypothetical protein